MDDSSLRKLGEIRDIKEIINFIQPYYPELNINDFKIVEIEQALFHIFIKLIGKVIVDSPLNMRLYLMNYLLKFEITNIKQIIFGLITGMSLIDRKKRINILVEELLQNQEFIESLLDATNLEEIQLLMKDTKFNKPIREGILYFKNNNEIFVLDAFLDQLYYEYLNNSVPSFKTRERKMVKMNILIHTEIYNLRIISRGIKNNIDQALLEQFLVENYLLFNKDQLKKLLKLTNLEDFYSQVYLYLNKSSELKSFRIKINISKIHFIRSLREIYYAYYFKKNEVIIDNIEYFTIYQILKLLIKKDHEIKFNIMPNVIRLIHDNYERLEDKYGSV